MTALLELRDVRVKAARRVILDVPALSLHPRSTVAVLGRNGAGKSTLLRVACAVQQHDGTVLLNGRAAPARTFRRTTAAVLQRPVLRRGTVRGNVETGLRFHGVDRRTRRAEAERWMARLGLEHLAERPAHTLSGGEAQRTSLARALAVRPELLLLDEPLTGLDTPTRAELLADLRDVLAETGTAALLVTHDLDEAIALADRLVLLHDGCIRQDGSSRDVIDHPADRVCAELLAYENVIGGSLAERLLGRPADVAVRAGDCVVGPATDGDAPAGDVRLDGRLLRLLPYPDGIVVVADVDDVAMKIAVTAPPPAWIASMRPGGPLAVRVPRSALRHLIRR